MSPNVAAFLQSWPSTPWTILTCVFMVVVYGRGWRVLVRRGSSQFGTRHLLAFVGGLAAILLAVSSPLEPFANLILSVHMAQHLLLMFVAAPLLLLAAPQLPLMLGTPAAVLEYWMMPVAQTRVVRAFGRFLAHPAVAWSSATLTVWIWHLPRCYEMALDSDVWHVVEHGCFLATALLFWWPVVQPYPSRPVWPRVAMLPYLFLAAMQGTILCAFLTFADRVIYPRYEAVPRLWGLSALTDQALAGAMMWIAGLVAYCVPMVYLGDKLLYRVGSHRRKMSARTAAYAGMANGAWETTAAAVATPSWMTQALPRGARGVTTRPYPSALPIIDLGPRVAAPGAALDLLRMPLVGRLLRSPYTRRAMQATLMILAGAIVVDGLLGPPVAPLNLAGVLPWIHWRGLVVLTLLVVGNFFCMACPFTLPRAIARRWLSPPWEWPAWLRSKWLAIGLLVGFFWAYEVLDVWASPWWTAWIVIGYFVAAATVDMLYRGATFCKYVCPIGQFQFVQSMVSPWEVRVRDARACTTCRTKECIRGGATVRGCEMDLFAPRKTGNLDCTFCLDCVTACPVSNIGVLATVPGSALLGNPEYKDSNRLNPRPDVAALILLLVFAAFVNAAGMIAPVVAAEERVAGELGLPLGVVESCYLAISLIVLPLLIVGLVSLCAHRRDDDSASALQEIARFAGTLAPLGAAMWLAHYGFHLATGALSCVPAVIRFLSDGGWPVTAAASLVRSCCAVDAPDWLLRAELLSLDLGLLTALYFMYRVAFERPGGARRALAQLAPWCSLAVALFALGVWILLQPMEMRGTLAPGDGVLLGGGG